MKMYVYKDYFFIKVCGLIVMMLILSGCGRKSEVLISIDGSSTVYPITEAVVEEFLKKNKDIRITIGISGTGGGFKKFIRGEIDIVNASRQIKPAEVRSCQENGVEYIELPVAFDGICVVVNPRNNWVDYLTVEELKKIWEPQAENKILKWNQIRPKWPNAPINLYGPGVASGTFDYFTEAICGEEKASRGDYTSSEDDNLLVQGVARDSYALGYFGMAYYQENKDILKAVAIDDGDPTNGQGGILPTRENVEKRIYQPLSRPLFIYINKKSAERQEIKEFIEFYINNVGRLVKEVGYVPLPSHVYDLALKHFKDLKTTPLNF